VAPSFELQESKLHPPWPGRSMVPRTSLLERLLAAPAPRLLCVAAPPGYGKTTLLAQWAERRGGAAWVSLDRRDNDPVVLLSYLAVALDRVGPVDPGLFRTLASPGAASAASLVPRFVASLSSMAWPVAVVLDNLEQLANQDCLDAVAEVALRLPDGSQLAMASRARPALPEALTRPSGLLLEVGPDELAMDGQEARALLEQLFFDPKRYDLTKVGRYKLNQRLGVDVPEFGGGASRALAGVFAAVVEQQERDPSPAQRLDRVAVEVDEKCVRRSHLRRSPGSWCRSPSAPVGKRLPAWLAGRRPEGCRAWPGRGRTAASACLVRPGCAP